MQHFTFGFTQPSLMKATCKCDGDTSQVAKDMIYECSAFRLRLKRQQLDNPHKSPHFGPSFAVQLEFDEWHDPQGPKTE